MTVQSAMIPDNLHFSRVGYFLPCTDPSIYSEAGTEHHLRFPHLPAQSFTRSEGASVLAYANLGGAWVGAAFGWFMHPKFGHVENAHAGWHCLLCGFRRGICVSVNSSLLGWTPRASIAVGPVHQAAIVSDFYTGFLPAAIRPSFGPRAQDFALSVDAAVAALSLIWRGVALWCGLGLLKSVLIMAMDRSFALLLFSMLKLKIRD